MSLNLNSIEKFEDLFGDLDSIESEKIEEFVQETLKIFESIRETIKSSNQEERTKALEVAMHLQKKLEFLAEKSLKKTGLTHEGLNDFVSNTGNLSSQEREVLENSENAIRDYNRNMLKKIETSFTNKTARLRA